LKDYFVALISQVGQPPQRLHPDIDNKESESNAKMNNFFVAFISE